MGYYERRGGLTFSIIKGPLAFRMVPLVALFTDTFEGARQVHTNRVRVAAHAFILTFVLV